MNKITTISERLKQVTEYLDISSNEFAKKLSYGRSQAIYDIINGKSKPSFDFFEKLSNSEYSETFNYEWLISGKGTMLKATINNGLYMVKEDQEKYGTNESYCIESLKEAIVMKDKIIAMKDDIISSFEMKNSYSSMSKRMDEFEKFSDMIKLKLKLDLEIESVEDSIKENVDSKLIK